MAHPGGRPPKFSDLNVDEAQKLIDQFFEDCTGKPIMVNDPDTGEERPYIDKYGQPVIIGAKPPTVTGLCLALGFNSRNALLDYEANVDSNPELANTITRAKLRCHEYAESRLYDKDGANGAKFSLANNFGWIDRQEISTTLEVNMLPEADRRSRLIDILSRRQLPSIIDVECQPTEDSQDAD
jgi:hypothetical protein